MSTLRLHRRLAITTGTALVLPIFIFLSLAWLDWKAGEQYELTGSQVVTEAFALLRGKQCGEIEPISAAVVSVTRVLLCIWISAICGVVIGTALYSLGPYRHLFGPTIDFLRALPVTFVVAPAAMAAGLMNPNLPWAIACFPCSLIICVCIADRASAVDEERRQVVATLFGRRRWWLVVRHLYMFEIFAGFVTGLRLAVPYAIILVGVLEYVGAGTERKGFGFLVSQVSQGSNAEEVMLAAVLLYGAFGLVLVSITGLICRQLASWQTEGPG